MENVDIFQGHLLYLTYGTFGSFFGLLIYLSQIVMLDQEQSGNPAMNHAQTPPHSLNVLADRSSSNSLNLLWWKKRGIFGLAYLPPNHLLFPLSRSIQVSAFFFHFEATSCRSPQTAVSAPASPPIRVARFFFTQHTKMWENIPNYHKITKWP
jgi:hypothetical protein